MKLRKVKLKENVVNIVRVNGHGTSDYVCGAQDPHNSLAGVEVGDLYDEGAWIFVVHPDPTAEHTRIPVLRIPVSNVAYTIPAEQPKKGK